MYSPETDALVGDVDGALSYLIDSGQTGAPQYTDLARARSGLLSEPEGTPGYDSYAGLAEAQVNQVNDMRTDAFAADPASDPEFGAAACDCEPGEPCCLRAFEVEDAEKAGRKVVWPIPDGGPDRLYVVAKEPLNGQPSAKVKVTLTDKDTCKLNFAKPRARPNGHADGPSGIMASDEISVTTPFQMPGFYSAMLPREAMLVIYLVGTMLQLSTYRSHRPVKVDPDQCMMPGASGVEVFAMPHVNVNASIEGELSIALTMTSLPTLGAGLKGNVTGEVGNQTISWTAEASTTSAPRQSSPQGPINHPLFDFLDKIQTSLDAVADHGQRTPFKRSVQRAAQPLSLVLKLVVKVEIAKLALEGKSGSPNLQLALDPFALSINPSVTGTVDIWQLMLSRIPGGRDIAAALAHPGNAVNASAKCEVTISGSGTAAMAVNNAVNIEIGSGEDLERSFGQIATTFTASCELTADIKASARLNLRTWLIEATATAGASASTGWSFGGRVTNNADGTQKWERMHGFQGITLSARAQVSLGATVEISDDIPFGNAPDSPTVVSGETSDTTSVQSDTAGGSWTRTILQPDGNKHDWYEV